MELQKADVPSGASRMEVAAGNHGHVTPPEEDAEHPEVAGEIGREIVTSQVVTRRAVVFAMGEGEAELIVEASFGEWDDEAASEMAAEGVAEGVAEDDEERRILEEVERELQQATEAEAVRETHAARVARDATAAREAKARARAAEEAAVFAAARAAAPRASMGEASAEQRVARARKEALEAPLQPAAAPLSTWKGSVVLAAGLLVKGLLLRRSGLI